jgi:hypothetical protein
LVNWYKDFEEPTATIIRIVKEEYFMVKVFVFYPEDGGSKLLRNICINLPINVESQLRRL